jgi:hypothetical protein
MSHVFCFRKFRPKVTCGWGVFVQVGDRCVAVQQCCMHVHIKQVALLHVWLLAMQLHRLCTT